MSHLQRFPLLLTALVLLIAGGAFALGIGVWELVGDDDAGASGVRAVRAGGVAVARDGAAVATPVDRGTRFGLLDEVYDILERDFFDPSRVQTEPLRTAAILGLLNRLDDPHSVYIDEETFRLSSEDISGEFEGIGATVDQQGEEIVITGTFRDSPAQVGGIRTGDVILAVDGESTEGWSVQAAVARIRGPRGTQVAITVRHRTEQEVTITITRDRIVVPSVQALEIQDRDGLPVSDLAYLVISQYTEKTRDELIPILESVEAGNFRGLIIDLRGNPGGLLTATVDTVGEFLDGGLVLTEVHRDGSEQKYSDGPGGAALDLPVVLLVDGGSASGSEVMAGALRDHGRAVLIGEQTLGKGTVNIPRRLSDGSVLYVSIARWLTPNGDQIEGVGLVPDFTITPSDEEFELRRDVQLFAAIDFLRGKTIISTPAPAAADGTTPEG